MAELIKAELNLKAGSSTPGPLEKHATISEEQLKKIAERKMPELTAHSVEAAMATVAGTARSMGIVVE